MVRCACIQARDCAKAHSHMRVCVVFVDDVGQSEVEKLQAAYKKLQEDKEEAVGKVKSSGLGLMKAVKAANKKK